MIRSLSAGDVLTDAELIASYQVDDRQTPYLRANMVASIDGAVEIGGLSGGLSTTDDQEVFARLRLLTDVVLVGAGTLRDEGYGGIRSTGERRDWRLDHGLAENPRLAVVSARLDLDPASPALAESAVRPLVVTHAAAPARERDVLAEVADVLICGETEVDLALMKDELARLGLPQILCEGGPHLLGALTEADLLDELCLSVAPLVTGPGAGRIVAGPPGAVARRMVPRQVLSSDDGTLLLRYITDPQGQ